MQDFNWTLLVVVMFVSLLSGAGSFLHQRRTKRHKKAGWLVEMITELVMAVTAGLAALFVGWWQVFPPPLTCLIALIAASNGAAFMELGRKFLTNKIESGGRNG